MRAVNVDYYSPRSCVVRCETDSYVIASAPNRNNISAHGIIEIVDGAASTADHIEGMLIMGLECTFLPWRKTHSM